MNDETTKELERTGGSQDDATRATFQEHGTWKRREHGQVTNTVCEHI